MGVVITISGTKHLRCSPPHETDNYRAFTEKLLLCRTVDLVNADCEFSQYKIKELILAMDFQ